MLGALVADDVNDVVEFTILEVVGIVLTIPVIVAVAVLAVSEVTVCVSVFCDGDKVPAPDTEVADLPKAVCVAAPKDSTDAIV